MVLIYIAYYDKWGIVSRTFLVDSGKHSLKRDNLKMFRLFGQRELSFWTRNLIEIIAWCFLSSLHKIHLLHYIVFISFFLYVHKKKGFKDFRKIFSSFLIALKVTSKFCFESKIFRWIFCWIVPHWNNFIWLSLMKTQFLIVVFQKDSVQVNLVKRIDAFYVLRWYLIVDLSLRECLFYK